MNGAIAMSRDVIGEIAEVLARPKFRRAINDEQRSEILELLLGAAVWVEPSERADDCRVRKDNMYLELAVAAEADFMVSGDHDLLVLNPWRGIRSLNPAAFLIVEQRR